VGVPVGVGVALGVGIGVADDGLGSGVELGRGLDVALGSHITGGVVSRTEDRWNRLTAQRETGSGVPAVIGLHLARPRSELGHPKAMSRQPRKGRSRCLGWH